MKPYMEVAVSFASALVSGDFVRANALLITELRTQLSPDTLREKLYGMFRGYACGEPRSIFEEQFQLDDWPDKRASDVGWAYLGIVGDDFIEGVTVVVAKIEGELLIREVEWGRP